MVTIRDVATAADVAVSTASRALNNNPRISQKSRDRIQLIAKDMGYRVNSNAKNLSLGESNVVGVIFPVTKVGNQENTFHIDMMRGVNKELAPRKYVMSVAMGQTDTELLSNVQAMVLEAQIHRFILLYSKKNDMVTQFLSTQNDVRYVVIGEPVDSGTQFYVNNDNVLAGFDATKFLERTYNSKHILFIKSNKNWNFEIQREHGFNHAIDELKIKHESSNLGLRHGNDNSDRLISYIRAHSNVDGVVAADDMIGFTFFNFWKKTFNKDIPVIVFNNNQLFSRMGNNNFHCVDLYPDKLGQEAAKLVFSDDTRGYIVVPHKVR
ncbi:LacI family DNA-binding transcriptional regulator [Dellaglioa carnosa]|uniref:LacI family DNA-binding transcriptional regulator n=1 Tax=Dellaglioa carnosa TaxID=2995136 RepID=UPI0022A865C4|nr:LacI family DNA-binding transcriptional regulator [Dellaglioa carnosa]MCZ2492707.1 LacI family DNA-binding transcriptional regulator [Dellaglioa carnosa]